MIHHLTRGSRRGRGDLVDTIGHCCSLVGHFLQFALASTAIHGISMSSDRLGTRQRDNVSEMTELLLNIRKGLFYVEPTPLPFSSAALSF